MSKKQIQKRVLQNGKPLALSKFSWDEKTKTFSSLENNLVLDFNNIFNCTFKTGSNCTFDTDSHCTFDTDSHCTFDTDSHCTFKTGSNCTFKTGLRCTFDTGWNCTFKTGSNCTFKTGSHCTFDTDYQCTFNTASRCTFDTDLRCTFKTGSNCTFNTGYQCTFNTGSTCTFDTGWNCTFKTGEECVIIRRDIFEVIQPKANEVIQLCPSNIKGYLLNGNLNGIPHIIADNILSKIIHQKGDIYKVINHGSSEQSFLIKQGDIYSHGDTLKEARESLIYKLINKDTSQYESLTLDTELTLAESIEMYRSITGACESGTRYFVEQNQDKVRETFTIRELIELTNGQYENNKFKEFFK